MLRRPGLALPGILMSRGCVTIWYPKQALMPRCERGDIDGVRVILDSILSIPIVAAALIRMALGGGGGPGPKILNALPPPLSMDTPQRTLWHPKDEPKESLQKRGGR